MHGVYSLLENFRENVVREKIDNLILWSALKHTESNSIVRSMHVWLILVPVAARIMAKFETPLYIPIADKTYILDISLPFTWSIFFFSALFFTIGNILFIFFSPKIIKENDNYRDFEQAGKDEGHLEGYFNKVTLGEWKMHLLDLGRQFSPSKPNVQEWFWKGYDTENISRVTARRWCAFSYLLGFSLILYVAAENILWVTRVGVL